MMEPLEGFKQGRGMTISAFIKNHFYSYMDTDCREETWKPKPWLCGCTTYKASFTKYNMDDSTGVYSL